MTDQGCMKEEVAVEDDNMNNSTEEIVVKYNHEDLPIRSVMVSP